MYNVYFAGCLNEIWISALIFVLDKLHSAPYNNRYKLRWKCLQGSRIYLLRCQKHRIRIRKQAEKEGVFTVRSYKIRFLPLLLVCVLVLSLAACQSNTDTSEESGVSVFVPVYKEGSYGEYLQTYSRISDADPKDTIKIDITKWDSATDDVTTSSVGGKSNVVVTTEESEITYKFDVAVTGMYAIGIDYYTVSGKKQAIEREVFIDGATPYTQSESVCLDRVFVDDTPCEAGDPEYFIHDAKGNQLRPSQVEDNRWIEGGYFKDSSGSYDGPMKYYLEKGTHTITFTSIREPLAYSAMYLYGAPLYQEYTDTLSKYAAVDVNGNNLVATVECEYPSLKSSSTLFAGTDRASAATSPAASGLIKMNILGSTNGTVTWKTAGQWVEYKVNVANAGLYKLVLRARQNVNSGTFSCREITVNGELPYEEAASVRFAYNNSWQMVVPKDEYGEDLLWYFNAGENTIRIKAVLGDMSDIINAVEAVIAKLNADYRKITMLTGSSPDKYRDYDFDEEIPETIADLKAQADTLVKIYDEMISVIGSDGEMTATLKSVYNTLYNMNEKPDKIAKFYGKFKNDIGNLGDWISTMRSQPLEVDYIHVTEPKYKVGSAEKGVFANIGHQVSMFFSSFFSDVNSISSETVSNYDQTVKVWMAGTTSSRDFAQILRNLIDRSFIDEHKINVELSLVPGGALLPSVLAGKGPDVSLNMVSETIINYAARNALQELDVFDDFDEFISKNFLPSAITPTTLEWGESKGTLHYGVPETQSCEVMFYRQDIVDELEITLPNSWDEVYVTIAKLQKSYMDFAPPGYGMLLYQMGGHYYNAGGITCALDDTVSIEAFIKWTDFYTSYKLPVEFNFANRFRYAEMPIGCVDYGSAYPLIKVFAPEINGLWAFTNVPGTVDEKGNIDRTTVSDVVSCAMMNKDDDKERPLMEASWEFMKWWCGSYAQAQYGMELESLLGVASRYSTANTEALKELPWTAKELNILLSQREWIVGYPQMPGAYAMTRNLNFAFYNVINDSDEPRETLLDYVKTINDELYIKRKELGLPLE